MPRGGRDCVNGAASRKLQATTRITVSTGFDAWGCAHATSAEFGLTSRHRPCPVLQLEACGCSPRIDLATQGFDLAAFGLVVHAALLATQGRAGGFTLFLLYRHALD